MMKNIKTKTSNPMATTFTLAFRNLLKTLHNPDSLMDAVVQPALFMILFGYLFGGAIAGSVKAYLPIIVPGILMQSMLAVGTGSGEQIREDINSGIYTRFKSLPINRIAPIAGQLFADILRLVLAALVCLLTGFLMGWRPHVDLVWIGAIAALAVFTGWAISWIFAFVGLLIKNVSLIESISLMIMLVLSFLSNAFVPIHTMPKFMQFIARCNPITYVISAIRGILKTGGWTKESLIVVFLGLLIILFFAPLTVFVYNHGE